MTERSETTDPGTPKWRSDQQAYDAGYDEAGRFPRKKWPHLTFANAYACGASDRQNQAPKNRAYRPHDYDRDTFERLPPKVEGLDDA